MSTLVYFDIAAFTNQIPLESEKFFLQHSRQMVVRLDCDWNTHLNVDDENVILGSWDDGGQGTDESLVERREKGSWGRVVQSYRN